MITRGAAAHGLTKSDANYLARIDEHLREIKAIQKDIVRKRTAGRKVTSRIDRNLKGIQNIIERVQATL